MSLTSVCVCVCVFSSLQFIVWWIVRECLCHIVFQCWCFECLGTSTHLHVINFDDYLVFLVFLPSYVRTRVHVVFPSYLYLYNRFAPLLFSHVHLYHLPSPFFPSSSLTSPPLSLPFLIPFLPSPSLSLQNEVWVFMESMETCLDMLMNKTLKGPLPEPIICKMCVPVSLH